MHEHRIYLFIHVIFTVQGSARVLNPALRSVYFGWLKKHMPGKAIRILTAGGGEEHVHLLLQLHPAQNLLQVVRQVKEESLRFINESLFLPDPFSWEDEYTAFTVSPGAFNQTMEYIAKQDEYHKQRSFEQEMEQINNTRINTDAT
jgi:REP element-mobilizing transposase RayT